jgi:hypothetical protein
MRFDESYDWWLASIKLPSFRDVTINVAGRKSTSKPINLVVRAEDDGPMDAQAKAYSYCLENQQKIREVCLRGIVKTAKRMRAIFEKSPFFAPGQLDQILPKSPTPEDLRKRLRLTDIWITDRVSKGTAYMEYHFDSAWDPEHGMLVVLLRDRLAFSGLTGEGW